MWGLTVDEATATVLLWPDNVLAVNAFAALSTQWRMSMSGPTGLDYNAIPNVLRLTGIPRAEWPEVFDGIRICEGAALKKMREK